MNSEHRNNDPPGQPAENSQLASGASDNANLQEFERLVSALAQPTYLFRLYVSGTSPRSAAAIHNVRRICEEYLAGHFELEVIDVYQQGAEIKKAQIIAVPTLIKELPLPPQRFIGDMSDTEKIVIGLKLKR
jgi:circadian clock protein KaiB